MLKWVRFPGTDPFFTDLSGLTLQSGVGVGPGGRLVKDEYTVGGGGVTGASSGVGVNTGMDVDSEINQTIQHHPPPQQQQQQSASAANSHQQNPQQYLPSLSSAANSGEQSYLSIFVI